MKRSHPVLKAMVLSFESALFLLKNFNLPFLDDSKLSTPFQKMFQLLYYLLLL